FPLFYLKSEAAYVQIEFVEQRRGDMVAEFSQIDECLFEKFRIVSADDVGGQIAQIPVPVGNEQIAEFVFFLRRQRTDKGVIDIGRRIDDGRGARRALIGRSRHALSAGL